jgi:hypothetical protein
MGPFSDQGLLALGIVSHTFHRPSWRAPFGWTRRSRPIGCISPAHSTR